MRVGYALTAPTQSEWRSEWRILSHWSYWVARGNEVTVYTNCGLTKDGSPHTIMDKIWECGAADAEDVTGYAGEVHVPDYVIPEVDRFMQAIQPLMPDTYHALVARHRRIVHGHLVRMRNERWIARALFGGHAGEAHMRLCQQCEIGYGMLRLRLQNFMERITEYRTPASDLTAI